MTTKSARYERKLSGIERFSIAINEIYRYNVDGFAVGSGSIDINELRKAVSIAAEANPGVRVRLRSFLGFSKWVDSGIPPEVKEVSAPLWDFNSDRGAEFLQEGFSPLSDGPVSDVIVIHGKDKIGIMFRGLHAAIDGRAIMYWGQDVFRAMRGEALVGAESTLVDFEVAERFRDKFEAASREADKKVAAPMPVYMPVVPPSPTIDSELEYMWRTVAIPRRITTILPRLAVYLARYARKQGDGVVGFTVPIDYRGLRVEANSNGNLTGYLRIHVSPEDTPKTIMQQLNQQIRDYVDCRFPLMAKPLRWVPMRMLIRKLRKNRDSVLYTQNSELPTGGLVSMGHNDLASYSTPTFTCERSVGIPGSVGKLNVVAVNCSDTTYVTFSTPKTYNRDGQIDQMIEDFVAEFSK